MSSPYARTFLAGAVWFTAIALKMVSRHPGHWSTYPPQNFLVLLGGWAITALLLGVVAARFERLRSWWSIGLGTVAGSFAVLGLMLLIVERIYGPPTPNFKNTDEMMAYFATEATKWVKKDRGIDLDYSVDSIKIVEEELARISKDVDKVNPQQGTFGLATGYGAYIGEVLRWKDGGSWAVDHTVGGPHSYPLTIKGNSTVFPVGWCWKRLTLARRRTFITRYYYGRPTPVQLPTSRGRDEHDRVPLRRCLPRSRRQRRSLSGAGMPGMKNFG